MRFGFGYFSGMRFGFGYFFELAATLEITDEMKRIFCILILHPCMMYGICIFKNVKLSLKIAQWPLKQVQSGSPSEARRNGVAFNFFLLHGKPLLRLVKNLKELT